MIYTILDTLNFIFKNFPFLFALGFYTILAIALSKSIREKAKFYYWWFGLLSAITVFFWVWIMKASPPDRMGIVGAPVFPQIAIEFAMLANMGHALLVIIMYMGALDKKTKYVAGLMKIRKELSILVGFPVILHTLKRITLAISSFGYFIDREAYMEKSRSVSELAVGISSTVYILGIVMFVLFMVLWVTSFDSVRLKMGSKKWKATQRWSYALYAMLFIQAFGLHLGRWINQHEMDKMAGQTEQLAVVDSAKHPQSDSAQPQQKKAEQVHPKPPADAIKRQQMKKGAAVAEHSPADGAGSKPNPQQTEQKEQPKAKPKGGHPHFNFFALADIELGRKCTSTVNMIFLFAVYGSYLFLRLRKAKKQKERRFKSKRALVTS